MALSLRPVAAVSALVVALGGIAYLPATAASPDATRARPAAATAAARADRDAQAPTDRFIVRFREDAHERGNAVARQRFLDGIGQGQGVRLGHARKLATGADLVRSERKLDVHAAKRLMLALARDPRVASVEAERVYHAQATTNDPLFEGQYQLHGGPWTLQLPRAWDRSTGLGAVVAVVDSGVTDHSDLSINVVPGYDFVSDAFLAADGDGRDADPTDPGNWSLAGDCGVGSAARDSTWHGTWVSGLVAAVGNNSLGSAGAAHNARVMPLRVMGKCDTATTTDIADAIVWAAGGTVAGVPANANPAEVINASFGSYGGCSPTLQAAIDSANAAGAVVVAAAGDSGDSTDYLMPASCDGVIAVGTGRGQRREATATSLGHAIDVLGPGGYLPLSPDSNDIAPILSTSHATTATPVAPNYTTATGSSMATAIASGTVAIMQQLRPQSPAVVAAVLRQTAMDERNLTCEIDPDETCAGLFDADAATHAVTTPTLVLDEWRFVMEGNGGVATAVPVTVTLTEPVTHPVSFTLETVANTATADDFVALAPTVFTIPAGQTGKTIELTVHGDDDNEPVEYFNLVMGNVTGASVLAREARITIGGGDDGGWLRPGIWNYAYPGYDRFEFEVPPGATDVQVSTAYGQYGDADLYVRKDAPPTLEQYDCASTNWGFNETCDLGTVSGHYHAWVATPYYYGDYVYIRVTWTNPGTTVSIADVSVVEGDADSKLMVFKVTRTPVSDAPVTFAWETLSGSTESGTATNGTDYYGNWDDGYVIPANRESASFSIPVIGDTELEPNETVVAILTGVTGATIADGYAVGTILNDEGPTLSVGDVTIAEGQSGTKTATVDVRLSEPSASAVSFQVATVAGTATAGEDFVAVAPTTRTIAAGATSTSVSFTINGDTTPEAHESVFVQLGNGSVTATDDLATVTINNDDGPGLSIGDITVAEGYAGVKVATFTVQLAEASDVPVSFGVRTVAGTATAGVDYLEQVATGTIPAGMLAQTFSVAILGDHLIERNETFFVVLSDAVNAVLLDGAALGTISNDDRARLSIGDIRVNESNVVKAAVFTVSLDQPIAVPVTFTIGTTGQGTATAGVDYVARTVANVGIPAGQTSKTFAVTINGDTTFEGDENFVVAASNVVNADVLDGSAFAVIVNDDNVPTLAIGDRVLVEGNGGTQQAAFVVTLSHAALSPVTFTAATTGAGSATAGDDYAVLAPTTYTIPAGQLSRNVLVTVNGDASVENTETYVVGIGNVLGAALTDGTGLGTITNDDKPVIGISDASLEEYFGVLQFEVRLSQPAPYPIGFDARTTGDGSATAGVDYTVLRANGLVFQPGEMVKIVDVIVADDAATEKSETLAVVLKNISGATAGDINGLGIILDNDMPELSITGSSVTEGNAGTRSLVYTVTLSKPAPYAVSYQVEPSWNYSTDYQDFQAWTPSPQVIPAGQLSKTFTVTINGDTQIEDNDWLGVYLTNPTGALIAYEGSNAIGYILNDDFPTITVSDAQTYEGDDGQYSGWLLFTVTLSDYLTYPVTVDVATNGQGSATAGVDYEPVGQQLTFEPYWGLTQQVWVGVHGDNVKEASETLVLQLSNPVNGVIADGAGLGTILNDDQPPPTLAIGNASAVEGDSGPHGTLVDFTVELSAPASNTVYFEVTSTGQGSATGDVDGTGDYTLQSNLLFEIPAGQTQVQVPFPIHGDQVDEADETFVLTIGNPQGATIADGAGLGTIVDDDGVGEGGKPTLSILDAAGVETDGGQNGGRVYFTVQLSAPATQAVRFDVMTTGQGTATMDIVGDGDYTDLVAPITWEIPAGESQVIVPVAVHGDMLDESNETFVIHVSNAQNAWIQDFAATGTIVDDDGGNDLPLISIVATSQFEGDAGNQQFLQFHLALSETSSSPITFVAETTGAGTATADVDYYPRSPSVVFVPAGDQNPVVTIQLKPDTVLEPDETFVVRISDVQGATQGQASAVGTIVNDD
jgi:hypothetical protein